MPDAAAPETVIPGASDALFDFPDDPIFQAQEPYKGLPPQKEVIATLSEDGKKVVSNLRQWGQRAATEANAARVRAEAAEAELAVLRARPSTPAAPPRTEAADAFVSRLMGTEDGDPYEGVALPTIDLTADLKAYAEAEGVSEAGVAALNGIFGKLYEHGVRTGRADLVDASRRTAKPTLEATAAQARAAAEAEAARTTAEFRAATPGLDKPEGWSDFYRYARDMYPNTPEGRWPDAPPAVMKALAKTWHMENGAKFAAQPETVVLPPAAEAVVVQAPTKTLTAAELIANQLREQSQDVQGHGGVVVEEPGLRMPEALKQPGQEAAQLRWIDAHPTARRAWADGDRAAIDRIMGRRARA